MKGRAGLLSRSPSPPEEDDLEEGDADLSLHIVNESQYRRAIDDPLDHQHKSPTYTKKWADLYASASELVDNGPIVKESVSRQGDSGKVVLHGSDLSSQSIGANGGEVKVFTETVTVARPESSPEEGELQDEGQRQQLVNKRTFEEAISWREARRADRKKRAKCKPWKKSKKNSGAPSGVPSVQDRQEMMNTAVGDDGRPQVLLKDKESVITPVQSANTEEVVDENAVMRRLLRARRYFDPPDEEGDSCNNCGQVGHPESECPDGRQRKPCYVCGDLAHDGWFCPQKVNCFSCGKGGHIARLCPDRRARDVEVCMRCGDYDHPTSRCRRDYNADDLQHVKCYICKSVGHLSCRSVLAEQPSQLSCYNCGELGHAGDICRTSEQERIWAGSHIRFDDGAHNSRRKQARSRDESRKDIEGSPAGRPRRGIEPIQKMEDQVDMRHGFSLQDQSVAVTARGSPSRDADAGVTRHGRRGSSHRDSESRSSKKYSHHGGGSHHHRSQDGKSC